MARHPTRREHKKPKGFRKSEKIRWLDLKGTNVHHVPPRHPDRQPHFLTRKQKTHHAAYHMLFHAARSFEDCVEILLHDWWTSPEQRIEPVVDNDTRSPDLPGETRLR